MNILILREGDIRRACTMPEAIDAACEALRLYSAGVCDIPLRTTIAVPEGPAAACTCTATPPRRARWV